MEEQIESTAVAELPDPREALVRKIIGLLALSATEELVEQIVAATVQSDLTDDELLIVFSFANSEAGKHWTTVRHKLVADIQARQAGTASVSVASVALAYEFAAGALRVTLPTMPADVITNTLDALIANKHVMPVQIPPEHVKEISDRVRGRLKVADTLGGQSHPTAPVLTDDNEGDAASPETLCPDAADYIKSLGTIARLQPTRGPARAQLPDAPAGDPLLTWPAQLGEVGSE